MRSIANGARLGLGRLKYCPGRPAGRRAGAGYLIYGQKARMSRFITCEIVARSVASWLKKNTPLAKKPLRSACM